jgi:hypothetical protein
MIVMYEKENLIGKKSGKKGILNQNIRTLKVD